METWGKPCLTLVLLTVSAMVSAGQNLIILDKEPVGRVEVPFGSPLTLKCNLSTDEFETFRVGWYFNPFNQTLSKSRTLLEKKFRRSAKNSSRVNSEETLLNLTSSATENDSGWYFCRLTGEIPTLKVTNSSGTKVIIKSVERTTHPPLAIVTDEQAPVSPPDNSWLIDNWLWVFVGVSAFILIVLLITSVLLRRRCCRSRGEDPVYANTHPKTYKTPSPRPGMPVDNLKTVSSSQNLRNPSPGGRRYDDGKRRYK